MITCSDEGEEEDAKGWTDQSELTTSFQKVTKMEVSEDEQTLKCAGDAAFLVVFFDARTWQ